MSETSGPYRMTISRTTIDKLGIKLYDRVAAVLAELVANCYDADAENVGISAPLGVLLATETGGQIVDSGYVIRIEDDGHGMAPEDVNALYLKVGINRRTRGGVTAKGRKIMGRKGIGKLAPFGICREVEVVTAGGAVCPQGYRVSNFIMRLDDILSETDEDYYPDLGPLDGKYQERPGTTVILRLFSRRRVPSKEELHRQLAARFGLERADWQVTVANALDPEESFVLGRLPIEILEGTRIDLSERPVLLSDDRALPVSGWVAYAKDFYKDEAMAGVRIYARGKYVALTPDFGAGSGFTGEFKVRSYLVGEVHADWLDEEEDLIRSDRQDIIWNSQIGEAFRQWGRNLVIELAKRSEVFISERTWEEFLKVSRLEERLARTPVRDRRFRSSVMGAARSLVRRKDRDSLRDPDFVQSIVDLAFMIGPQKDLVESLREVAASEGTALGVIIRLFEKARLAETYSLGIVADDRVRAVIQLQRLLACRTSTESELQSLLEQAPWVLHPDWTPLSANETLTRVRASFGVWYQRKHGRGIVTTAVTADRRRPDFILLSFRGDLEVVEIKKPTHRITDKEFERAYEYFGAMGSFMDENAELKREFHRITLTLVCDDLSALGEPFRDLIGCHECITARTWVEVLSSTMSAHGDFLAAVRELQGEEAVDDKVAVGLDPGRQ